MEDNDKKEMLEGLEESGFIFEVKIRSLLQREFSNYFNNVNVEAGYEWRDERHSGEVDVYIKDLKATSAEGEIFINFNIEIFGECKSQPQNRLILGREKDRVPFVGAFIANSDPLLRFQYDLYSFFDPINSQAFDVFQTLSPTTGKKKWKDDKNQFIQKAATQLFNTITHEFPFRMTEESIRHYVTNINTQKEEAFKYLLRKDHFENCPKAHSKQLPLQTIPEDWIKKVYDKESSHYLFDLTLYLPVIFTKANTYVIEFNSDGDFQNLDRSEKKFHLILYDNTKWEDINDLNISTFGLATEFYFWIVEETGIHEWVAWIVEWIKNASSDIAHQLNEDIQQTKNKLANIFYHKQGRSWKVHSENETCAFCNQNWFSDP